MTEKPSRRAAAEPPASAVETVVRVRYAETDQMGVVYYARHLEWFEVGRAALCRDRGIAYRDLERERGLMLPVAEATCRYLAPARYDDEVTIVTWVDHRWRRAVRFGYVLRRGEDRLAEGSTTHVLVDRDGKACAWPEDVANRLDG